MEVKHLNTIQYLCHKYESVGCNLYTIKNLLESNENLQIRLIGKNLGGGVDREIKGIRIVKESDTEKHIIGGEILLTSLNVYEKMSKDQFLFHLEELNKKEISGFIMDYFGIGGYQYIR